MAISSMTSLVGNYNQNAPKPEAYSKKQQAMNQLEDVSLGIFNNY